MGNSRTTTTIEDMHARCLQAKDFGAFAVTCRRHASLRKCHHDRIRLVTLALCDYARLPELVLHSNSCCSMFDTDTTTSCRLCLPGMLRRYNALTQQERALVMKVASSTNSWLQILDPKVSASQKRVDQICDEMEIYARMQIDSGICSTQTRTWQPHDPAAMENLRIQLSETMGVGTDNKQVYSVCNTIKRIQEMISEKERSRIEQRSAFVDVIQQETLMM